MTPALALIRLPRGGERFVRHLGGLHHGHGFMDGLLHYLASAAIFHLLLRLGGILLVLLAIVALWAARRRRSASV